MTETPLERIATAEDDVWALLRERILSGHSAAALVADDVDQPCDVLADERVAVELVFRAGDNQESTTVLPLTEALRVGISTEAEIVSVGAPTPRPAYFFASAIMVRDGQLGAIISLRDLRGFGKLAGSPSYIDGDEASFGAWFRKRAARSGVCHVNGRRTVAIDHLRREYGHDAIVLGVDVEALATYSERWPVGHEWAISVRGDDGQFVTIATGPPIPDKVPPGPADYMMDMLSIEAFGATRRHLPRAQQWEQRLIEGSDEDMVEGGKVPMPPGVSYETDIERELPWNARLLGQWTLAQGGADPTGEAATSIQDVPAMLAADRDPAELWTVWRAAGLTLRQATVLAMSQSGSSIAEIANHLRIAKSTVSNHLAAARKKISDFS